MTSGQTHTVAVVGGIALTGGLGIQFEQTAEDTVRVHVHSVPAGSTAAIVESIVESLSGQDIVVSGKRIADILTLQVSPIQDIEKFCRAIRFGNVESVDGRAITVEYADQRLWGCTTVILPLAG